VVNGESSRGESPRCAVRGDRVPGRGSGRGSAEARPRGLAEVRRLPVLVAVRGWCGATFAPICSKLGAGMHQGSDEVAAPQEAASRVV